MFAGGAYGEQAFAEQDHVAGDDSAFRAFLARIKAERCWLLEIDALSLAVSPAMSGGFSGGAFAEAAFGDDATEGSTGTQTLRYSTHGWTRRDYGYADYLSLPGTNGNYASTPDSAAVSVTGDIDIRAKVAAADWAGVANLITKRNASDCFQLFIASGVIQFYTSSSPWPTATLPAWAANMVRWVRVTRVSSSGLCSFYWSEDGESWTLLGASVDSVTGALNDTADALEIGAAFSGTNSLLNGKIYYAELRNGIDGPVVAKFDPENDANPGDTSFTSSTGETWTINQSGSDPARLVAGGEVAEYYDARLTGDFTVDRNIVGRDGVGGLSRVFSEIALQNSDGGLDGLLRDYAVDGRAVRLLVGDVGSDYSTFGTVFAGVVESAGITEREVRLRCTDGLSKLALPIQANTYAGTGSLEGGADLKGKPKPLCYGTVRNIAPPLVDPVNLVYQVHDGAITDVTAVRDRGVALTRVTGAPAPGQYQPGLANGTFKLGATPDGEITCDVEGDTPSAGYTEHAGQIIQRILATRLATSEIDTTAFANLFSVLAAEVGLWIGTEIRLVTEVINELLDGVGAFGGFTRQGVFTIGRVAAASGTPVLTLDSADILSIEREPLPGPLEPVVWRLQVGWGRNYTVQTDVADLTADADRTFAAEPLRVAVAEDAAIRTQHLLARDYGPVPALYRDQADAEAEAERLFELWGERRAQYRVQTPIEGMLADLGGVVQVTHPRHLLFNGAAGRVVGQAIRGSRVELRIIV